MVYCAIGESAHFFRNKDRLVEHVELLFEALDLKELSSFEVLKDTKSHGSEFMLGASFNDEENGMHREWIKITTPQGKFWTCPSAWRLHCVTPLYDKNFNLIANMGSMKALITALLKEKRQ